MIWKIRRLYHRIIWRLFKKDYIEYKGYHCGCCGKWVGESIKVRTCDSVSKWWDTWGICKDCGKY